MKEKDWLTEVKDLRAASDPAYTAIRWKMDFGLELIGLRLRFGLTRAEVAR